MLNSKSNSEQKELKNQKEKAASLPCGICLFLLLMHLACPGQAALSAPSKDAQTTKQTEAKKIDTKTHKAGTQTTGPVLSKSIKIFRLRTWVQGLAEISFEKDKVKLENVDKGIILLFKAPQWKAQMYSPSAGLYYETNAAKWMPDDIKTIATFRPSDPQTLVPGTTSDTTLKNTPCKLYSLKAREQQKVSKDARTWQMLLLKEGKLWAIAKGQFPKDVTAALCRYLGTPQIDGIPLQLTATNFSGTPKEEVVLLKVLDRKVSADFFEVPQGLKKAKTIRDLAGQTANDAEVFEIMR